MKHGKRAIESSSGMMVPLDYDNKLNQVYAMSINNQSTLRRPDTIRAEDLVYPIRISSQIVNKYTNFANSHFNTVFSDFLFTETICIRMKKKTSREYLKLLETKQFFDEEK